MHSRFYNIWDCVVWNQDRNVKTIIKIPLMSEWLGGWRTKLRDSFADNQQIAQNILNVLNFPDAFKILKKSENGSNLHKICFSMTSFLWKDLLSTAPSMRKNVNLPWTFQWVLSATLAVVLPCISNLCCLCTAWEKRVLPAIVCSTKENRGGRWAGGPLGFTCHRTWRVATRGWAELENSTIRTRTHAQNTAYY